MLQLVEKRVPFSWRHVSSVYRKFKMRIVFWSEASVVLLIKYQLPAGTRLLCLTEGLLGPWLRPPRVSGGIFKPLWRYHPAVSLDPSTSLQIKMWHHRRYILFGLALAFRARPRCWSLPWDLHQQDGSEVGGLTRLDEPALKKGSPKA